MRWSPFRFAWGVCMLMLSNWKTTLPAKSTSRTLPISTTIAGTMIAGAAGILLATYVCVAALMAGAASHGQTTDPVTLIFPHFFEHSFTYLVVPMVAALVYEIACRSAHSSIGYQPARITGGVVVHRSRITVDPLLSASEDSCSPLIRVSDD